MAIETKTFNQLLGELVRKILPNTPLNDISVGSTLYTLLEAVAASDFDNNASVLSVLDLLTLDALTNNDLDNRAADYGLSRFTAQRASGTISISDSTISKRSTGLYAIKPAPIAGSTVLYVNDAAAWNPTGYLYIGRGTQSFEGPIPYTSIVDNGSFYSIQLGAVLQKDHLISDLVVDQQGKLDRAINAGTIVTIPANNQMPEIRYVVTRDAVIAAGEDTVAGVPIMAERAGSFANASIGTIVAFDSVPFTGAEVVNTSALTDGRDIEPDADLRERVKSYASTLARGTKDAILGSIIGVADTEESKQVVSAVISEPPTVGEPAVLYFDDGRGFQPSSKGQSVDVLLSSATGSEEFLQLANYPLPRPQAVNTADGPYELIDGMTLVVYVDGIEDSVQFRVDHFNNIAAATLPEIVVAINDNATSFKCRLTNNSSRLLLYPASHSAETIQVAAIKSGDNPDELANSILKFPTNKFSYISLYRNNELLKERETSATLTTVPFPDWIITAPGNLIVAIDGTPPQNHGFTTSDFGGRNVDTATLEEWVAAFNSKFAGLTATATSSGAMQLQSNRSGTASLLEVLGGTYFTKMFADNPKTSQGQQSDFDLNRQTGNLRIKTGISTGDSITAGTADAKGNVLSTDTLTGAFNVASDSLGRASNAIIGIDDASATTVPLLLSVGANITFSVPAPGHLRILATVGNAFASIHPRDFIYITHYSTGSWANIANTGLFKVASVGGHTTAGVDTYIDVFCNGGVAETKVLLALTDIMAFRLASYPQLWKGSNTPVPATASINDIIKSLDDTTVNIDASVFKTSKLKTSSSTETGGSIAILANSGTASAVFPITPVQSGNQSHVAHKVTSKDLTSYPRRSETWTTNLNSLVTAEVAGSLSASYSPSDNLAEPYEALLTAAVLLNSIITPSDIVSMTSGSNQGLLRSIKDIQAVGVVGTQHILPTTRLPFISGDTITVFKSLSLSPDDNVVFIIDQDSVNKTVVVPMSRTGRIHSMFPFNNNSFSAYDADNEPGITFDSIPVWGTTINKTDFKDYVVWFKARNWYVAGGAGSGLAAIFIRAAEYGPHGEKFTFKLEYPATPQQSSYIRHINQPSKTSVECVFGSGAARSIGISTGLQFNVIDLGNFNFQYQFIGPIDLTGVVPGDIVGITNTSGVSPSNNGTYRIHNVGVNYVDIYNPNGAATGAGVQEVVDVQCGEDTVGTPTQHTIATVTGAALNGTYFTINDDVGKVVYWYDVGNVGTPAPTVAGAYRYVEIATVGAGDSADTVATKTTQHLNLDNKFTATTSLNTITVINTFNGDVATATAGTSGFAVNKTIVGTADNSVNGKYFTIHDEDGSVAVWFNVSGIEPEPFHGADRSIVVTSVNYGDAAATIATKVAALLGLWSPSVVSDTITLTDPVAGGRNAPSDGTLGGNGFNLSTTTNGSNPYPETILVPSSFNIFPLAQNTVQEVVDTINTSTAVEAVALSTTSLLFEKATRDEVYVPGVGYSASLGYGHDPDPTSGDNTFISLYDAQTWVKSFQNAGPNFILKTSMLLSLAAPAAYNPATVPNKGITDIGEMFKLIPTTIANIKHHFSQKALSQLPIATEIDIANAYKSVQLKSKKLGSEGAIEVVGGRANAAEFSVFGEAQNITESGKTFTEVKVAAYPITLNVGDYVEVTNSNEVKRRNIFQDTDLIDVVASTTSAKYVYNNKNVLISGASVAISDVSGSYSKDAGTIWRWTFTVGDFSKVTVNDMLVAKDLTGSWSLLNQTQMPNTYITGFAVVGVNSIAKTIDVLNPLGVAMPSQPIGAGTVLVVPTPTKRWFLPHIAPISIVSISVSSGTATVYTATPHRFLTGDSVDITSPASISTHTITVIDTISFSISLAVADGVYSGGSCIKSIDTATKYRIENLGSNQFYRLKAISGNMPKFINSGTSTDDVLVIQGLTFKNSNTGKFRIYSASEDSIVFQNPQGTEELDTITPINPLDTAVIWTANVNTVTGSAGSFANVTVGSWVKKVEDEMEFLVQVIAINNTPDLATEITLGSNYAGTSSVSQGIVIDLESDINTGVTLKNVDDVMVFEGDSCFAGDTLFVDDIVDNDWFSIQNTGSFPVLSVALGSDLLPYIQVQTSSGISEADVQLAVDTSGVYILEGQDNRTTMVKEVRHVVIDEFDPNKRIVYLFPSNMSEKISQTYGTKIGSMGKLGYTTEVTTGIDGYLYYTGLMRKVQRIVDGFEPDPTNYPGRRAVGSAIESLPPLIRRISLSLEVTTNEGVNLNEISNDIISTIISYVTSLGVGQDVILSEVIVQVMSIKGVAATTFTDPSPTQERIAISDIEKAYIEASDISIA